MYYPYHQKKGRILVLGIPFRNNFDEKHSSWEVFFQEFKPF